MEKALSAEEELREPFVGSQTPPEQDRTAQRTQKLLIATRCVFLFAHGMLILVASLVFAWEVGWSWWKIFLPVWLGNVACLAMIVMSWFASCPYIQLCLAERQARLGVSNPSILTELLPQILLAILGLLFVTLSLIGELLLCRYLEASRLHIQPEPSPVPAMTVMMTVSGLAFCRGVCISVHGDIFGNFGGATLLTLVVALSIPEGPTGPDGWVAVLPALFGVFGLLGSAVLRLRHVKAVLYPEERGLHVAEQAVLLVEIAALVALMVFSARGGLLNHGSDALVAGAAGAVVGGGICILSLLRARMSMVEQRRCPIRERILVLAMGQQDHGINDNAGAFPASLRGAASRSGGSSGRKSARVISTTPAAKQQPAPSSAVVAAADASLITVPQEQQPGAAPRGARAPQSATDGATLGARLGLAGSVGISGPPAMTAASAAAAEPALPVCGSQRSFQAKKVPQIAGDTEATPSEGQLSL